MILVRMRNENCVKRPVRDRSIVGERRFTFLLGMQSRIKHHSLAVQLQQIRIRANLRLPGQIYKSHSLCEDPNSPKPHRCGDVSKSSEFELESKFYVLRFIKCYLRSHPVDGISMPLLTSLCAPDLAEAPLIF